MLFDDFGEIIIGHVSKGDKIPEYERKCGIVVFDKQSRSGIRWSLINEAEQAAIDASPATMRRGFDSERMIRVLADRLPVVRAIVRSPLNPNPGFRGFELQIEEIPDDMAVDRNNAVAGIYSGFMCQATGHNVHNFYRHTPSRVGYFFSFFDSRVLWQENEHTVWLPGCVHGRFEIVNDTGKYYARLLGNAGVSALSG